MSPATAIIVTNCRWLACIAQALSHMSGHGHGFAATRWLLTRSVICRLVAANVIALLLLMLRYHGSLRRLRSWRIIAVEDAALLMPFYAYAFI